MGTRRLPHLLLASVTLLLNSLTWRSVVSHSSLVRWCCKLRCFVSGAVVGARSGVCVGGRSDCKMYHGDGRLSIFVPATITVFSCAGDGVDAGKSTSPCVCFIPVFLYHKGGQPLSSRQSLLYVWGERKRSLFFLCCCFWVGRPILAGGLLGMSEILYVALLPFFSRGYD